MDVGIQTLFASHGWPGITDGQVYDEDTRLALLAEELGFDVVWAVEHHFYDYSFCPDNTEWLAYIAGRTDRIDVGTAAVIMPWNEPLRVAEKVALLDQVAGGRLRFGMGRGLSVGSTRTSAGSRWTSRAGVSTKARPWCSEALETATSKATGRTTRSPAPPSGPHRRARSTGASYAVASSDDSVDAAARLKAAMVMFADRSWKSRLPSDRALADAVPRAPRRAEPPPPLICDFVYCDADGGGGQRGPGLHGHATCSACSSTTRSWAATSRAWRATTPTRAPPAPEEDGRDRLHRRLPRGHRPRARPIRSSRSTAPAGS